MKSSCQFSVPAQDREHSVSFSSPTRATILPSTFFFFFGHRTFSNLMKVNGLSQENEVVGESACIPTHILNTIF